LVSSLAGPKLCTNPFPKINFVLAKGKERRPQSRFSDIDGLDCPMLGNQACGYGIGLRRLV
jgi:hypothetical protein